jgi:putative ABC transport system permease protein
MFELTESLTTLLSSMSLMMDTLSIFVSIILGFLVLYANNFLIKRRKKEFGIYLTLGMDRRDVTKILVVETMLVGLLSLIFGIILGVTLSHLMAIFSANLFDIKIANFTFVYSGLATLKTILYFLIIFLVVMVFNAFSISKLKLISLLNASKQNEGLKSKKLSVSFVLFIISLIILGISYYIAVTMDLAGHFNVFCVIGGIIGTYLFYYSLAGFFLKIVESNKKNYYKGLNTFIYRQLSSRINKTVVSTTIVCILLFLTLGILSSSSSMIIVFDGDVDVVSPYDASISSYLQSSSDDSEDGYKDNPDNSELNNIYEHFSEYTTSYIYETDIIVSEFFSNNGESTGEIKQNLEIVKLSDFNKIKQFNGTTEITLNDNEFYLISNVVPFKDYFKSSIDKNQFRIGDSDFVCKNREVDETALHNSNFAGNFATIVLNDHYIEDLKLQPSLFVANANFNDGDIEQNVKEFTDSVKEYNKNTDNVYIIKNTKFEYINQNLAVKMMLTYIGIYLGLIFLIACSTIIALIQLSEADENVERYKLLYKLGASDRDIKVSIFKSVFIGFITPLSLALVHSIFGIWMILNTINAFGDFDIINSVVYAFVIILTIYGSYFIITYNGVKRTITSSIDK